MTKPQNRAPKPNGRPVSDFTHELLKLSPGEQITLRPCSPNDARNTLRRKTSHIAKTRPTWRFQIIPVKTPNGRASNDRTTIKRLEDSSSEAHERTLQAAISGSDFRYPGDWKQPAYVTIRKNDPLALYAASINHGKLVGNRWVFTIENGRRAALDFADALEEAGHPHQVKTRV